MTRPGAANLLPADDAMGHLMRGIPPSSLLLVLLVSGCQPHPASNQTHEPELSCEDSQQDLISTLERLPERSVSSAFGVDLPESTLAGSLGAGPVLEVGSDRLVLDGAVIEGASLDDRLERLRARLAEWAAGFTSGGRRTVYVAAAADLEVRELRRPLGVLPVEARARLLFRAPAAPLPGQRGRTGHELAQQILAQRDPVKRAALARKGYRSFSDCDALDQAVERADGLEPSARWPMLREGLLSAARRCSCDSLRASNLKYLVTAEQRAGSLAFGSIPLTFLKDERCGASMPRRSIQKLLAQIEKFDAEFAGDFREEGLAFDEVVTNERLLNYFCDALPGETLAALQKARRTLYFRAGKANTCQAWTFSPLAPGSPMGTWNRLDDDPLSLHYWQGAEEIRVFGPATAESRPTDESVWPCNQTLRMEGIDAHSIRFEQGRWFFDEASCQKAIDAKPLGGCVGRIASGESEMPAEPARVEGASP